MIKNSNGLLYSKDSLTMVLESWKEERKTWNTGFNQFNGLRKTITIDKWTFGNHVEFMDLYIYKGNKFYTSGFLDFKKI